MSKKLKILFVMFISMGFFAGTLSATSVTLTNPSFELPGTGDQVTVWDSIPGWDSSPTDNGLYKGYNPTDGLWTCYELGSSYTVFQPTGHTIQSGVTYYLTVDAKAQAGTDVQITMFCWKGPEWESEILITSSDFSVSSTMAEKEISFNSDAHAGQQLIVGFECTGSSSSQMIAVDNVRVSYDVGNDTDPPAPDPMTWTFVPSADSDTQISMIATAASDPSGVEYYFMETSANPGASDSDWQDNRNYTDNDLDASTQYCYEVQARDKSVNQNATEWSTNQCATAQSGGSGTNIPITNPSFESGTTGWSGATTGNYEYYAAPDGTDYATRSDSAGYTTQLTGHTIAAGETFTLTLWARTIHSDSYVAALQTSNPYTTGNSATAEAEARFYYGSTTIDSIAQVVNPPQLQGDPQNYTNDDGGNVIVDQGYRMEYAENIFYQLESAHPILDNWTWYDDFDYDHNMAVSPVKTAQGFKALYSHEGSESPAFNKLGFNTFTGTPPDYTWGPTTLILTHTGDETPAPMDAHVYYDTDAGKLWLSWGGKPAYVSELDPSDGYLIGHPSNTEFDTHPAGAHTAAANWSGDEWTSDSEWFEGPCLFKHNGYWYYMVSYGNLGENYTIRGGRGNNPNGPFYDKDGIDMMAWDSSESEYGNSFVLGDDADQLVPGRPHIWEESGTYYLGYDYRHEKGDEGPSNPDIFGIRELYWVNDWPTIWTPITLTFNADDHPASIGQTLGISLRNTGASGSYVGFDHVSLEYTSGTPDTDPPTPDPMTWASVPTADDQDSISMTATTATDISGVEYYFMETSANPGGSDSGWQDPASYNDSGLNSSTQYCYEVQARDKSPNQNLTNWSSNQCATTDSPDTTPPSPDPMTWASVPAAGGSDNISMTATTATDPSGVSYYFDEITGNPGGSDSGWQPGTSYNDDGLSQSTTYTYTVTARDNSVNLNETAASTDESTTTDSGPVFADNFESATDWNNNWTAYGAWQRVTANPYDGSYSAEIDGGVTDSALVSVAIDVAGKDDATVTFAWLIESGLDSGEYLRFDVDTGSGWVQKASLDGNVDTENVWHNESIPVDVSAASTMSIRFRGKMSGSNEDAYVDVVEVTATGGAPDTTPPSPDPMTWASAPSADGDSAISMTATTATDVSGVEYYFDETSGNPGGSDSVWQDGTYYQDGGLNAGTQYCYEVAARDKSVNQNETAASSNQCATTTAPDTDPPTPDPMTWASVPAADSSSAISMTATTATDPSGVSYFFDETSGNPGGSDSSWQPGTGYTDDGLNAGTQYAYQVKARDNSANQNETAWSTPLAYATTDAGCSPTDCHVEAMVCSEQACGGPNDNGVATVTIYDDCGDPVVGADVYGTFTGSFSEQVMDTTDGNGVAVLVSTGCLKKPTFQVCVDDVDHTLPYDSNDNLVSCCND